MEMKKEIIYEDNYIKVETTGQDYDFIATIQNKTDSDLDCFIGNYEDMSCLLESNNWIGILANDEGYELINLIKEQGIRYMKQQFQMERMVDLYENQNMDKV